MINTGLPVKGYHKREAEDKKNTAIKMLNSGATLDMVLAEVEGAAFHKVPKAPKVPAIKSKVDFVKPEIFDELTDRGEEFPPWAHQSVLRDAGTTLRGSRGKNGNLLQVADYFTSWIENYHTQIRDSSYTSYSEQIYNRVIPYFSQFNLTMTELCSYDCTLFYRYCFAAGRLDGKEGDVSTSTVNRVHSYFSKGLSDAVRARLIQGNPARDAEIPPNNKFNCDPYNEDELEIIINAATGDACEFPILMVSSLGLSRSEACGIRERSYDSRNKTLSINHTVSYAARGKGLRCEDKTKNDHRNRTLPLEDVQAEYVELFIERNRRLRQKFGPKWNPQGYMCVWDDGALIGPNTVTKHLQRIAAKEGLPVKRLHDVRHSVISILMKHNVNMYKIKLLAGHANIETTERYTHYNTSDLVAATFTMSEAVSLKKAVKNLASNL